VSVSLCVSLFICGWCLETMCGDFRLVDGDHKFVLTDSCQFSIYVLRFRSSSIQRFLIRSVFSYEVMFVVSRKFSMEWLLTICVGD
jgi:hypothetical protein